MDAENLEKFNFAGFPRTSKALWRHHRLDDTMSGMTPLSIASPLPSSKTKSFTFEENIKRKGSNKILEPQCNFGTSYRDDGLGFKNEESPSPKRNKVLLLPPSDATTGSNTETSPSSRKEGSSATGSDSSFFKPGLNQSRWTLRSAGREKTLGVPCQMLAFTAPQAPKTPIPGLFDSSDESQPSTTSTLKDLDSEASQPDNDNPLAYRASMYLSDIDADDEHSDSDLETETGSDKENTDIDFLTYSKADNDDRLGLHLELTRIAIGEKRCRSPEDDDDEASNDNALGDKSSRIKEEENERSATRPLRLPECQNIEEQRREVAQSQRSKENQGSPAELPEQMKTPAKRVKFSDGEEQLAMNKGATARDRLDAAKAAEEADSVRDSLD